MSMPSNPISMPPAPITTISQKDDNTVIIEKAGQKYELSAISIQGQNTAEAVAAFLDWANRADNLESVFGTLSEKSVTLLKFDASTEEVQAGTLSNRDQTAYEKLIQTATTGNKIAQEHFQKLDKQISWTPILPSSPRSMTAAITGALLNPTPPSVTLSVNPLSTTSILPPTTSILPPLLPAKLPPSTTATILATASSTPVKSAKKTIPRVLPIGITNPDIACYRIASLQGLLANRFFRQELKKPITEGNHVAEREALRKNLVEFVQMFDDNSIDSKALSKKEQELNLAITFYSMSFDCALTAGINDPEEKQQLDAHDYIEFILTEVLAQANPTTKMVSGVGHEGRKKIPVSASMLPPSPTSVLSMNLKGGKNKSLTDLVGSNFSKEHVKDKTSPTRIGNHSLTEYDQVIQLSGPPKPMLTMRVERGGYAKGGTLVDNSPLKMPKPWFDQYHLVDLSTAYGHKKGTDPYEITSFIERVAGRNENETESGHFISYIKQGDAWLKCDDDTVSLVLDKKEIKQKMSTAYIFFLEKLPEKARPPKEFW